MGDTGEHTSNMSGGLHELPSEMCVCHHKLQLYCGEDFESLKVLVMERLCVSPCNYCFLRGEEKSLTCFAKNTIKGCCHAMSRVRGEGGGEVGRVRCPPAKNPPSTAKELERVHEMCRNRYTL